MHQRAPILVATSLALVAGPATAFDRLVVFGDSLADVGNVDQLTASVPLVPTTPGPFYLDGRFSNGPNFVDLLAADLGLSPPVQSLAGGDVWAYGGARVTGTPPPVSLVVDDVDDQVDDFLARTPVAEPDALYVVFAGGNDVSSLAGSAGSVADARDAAAEVVFQVSRLHAAGARNVLAPTIPLIGLTPAFNGDPVDAMAANALSEAFNDELGLGLDALASALPDLTLFRPDVAGLFADLVADPSAFGLANATEPAAPGLEPGDASYDISLIVPNPEAYLFWDDVHPTATGHALLADAFLTAIPEPSALALVALPLALLARRRG